MVDKSILLDDKQFTVGTFTDPDKLLHAVDKLKAKGVKIFDCYTPFPVHHLDHKLGYKRTNLTVGAFLCGLMGTLTGFTLAYGMNVVDWPMIIGGKPQDIKLFTSFIPVMFELTILFTAFGMMFLFFTRNRMVPGIREDLLDRRQTDDHLLIAIDNNEEQSVSPADINAILKEEGAVSIEGSVEPFNTSTTSEEELANSISSDNTEVETVVAKSVTQTEEATVVKEKVILSDEEKEVRLNLIKTVLGDASPDGKDDLKLISGVGPKYEETLNGIGIFTFEQVSKMTPETIKAIEEITQYFPGRIERDDWIGQALKLMNK